MGNSQSKSIFRLFSESDIEEIRAISEQRIFSENELIFSQGDQADSFYIIIKGQVSIFYQQQNKTKSLCALSDNEYFGEMAIYNQDKRSASVKATIKSTLLQIKEKHFFRFIEKYPLLAKKIENNLSLRNEELVLRENLLDLTGLNGHNLNVSIKGDPSLRESAFARERYESIVDKVLIKLEKNLLKLLLEHSVYSLFINFNSGEIRTTSVFNPFIEEVHTSDNLIEDAYIERHFPKISYNEKADMIRSIYQFISQGNHFKQLPSHWMNIYCKSHKDWQPVSKHDITAVISKLSKLRNIQNFYLRNFSISLIMDAIRMQFNCDGTHIVSAKNYETFLQENLE